DLDTFPASTPFLCRDTPTTATYTLSLHDALPISLWRHDEIPYQHPRRNRVRKPCEIHLARSDLRYGRPAALHRLIWWIGDRIGRSEEHTSELQSRENLVCRLLLEKKNIKDRCS